ncbi:small subunit of carbamoyl-phosphate synthase [Zopfochytrium polystomum]|nr:small subunit of carbamoyl-phosphate synthase [Zopfochytrium polystomum]
MFVNSAVKSFASASRRIVPHAQRSLATIAKDPIPSSSKPPILPAKLQLATGHEFKGISFGAPITKPVAGEVVFTTSLVGYPESMTDPSYRGQILVFTQPLVGNYGVPSETARDSFGLLRHFEAEGIQVKGIVVNDYAAKYSHWEAVESLGKWCERYGVPAISGVDSRAVVSLLRDRGSTLGEIVVGDVDPSTVIPEDPNARNLCSEVSTKQKQVFNPAGDVHVALVDCGVKQNIIRCLASQGAKVTVVPWDHDLANDATDYDGVFISNGPGDPRHLGKTVESIKAFIDVDRTRAVPTPIFGICMGNLVLGMAAGLSVYKLPFGNRGHNQPAVDLTTGRCIITSQNHGYALDDSALPDAAANSVEASSAGQSGSDGSWTVYFRNANDRSNEGIRHSVLPYSSVQFHPEAMGGPEDSAYLFSKFVSDVRAFKRERKREALTAKAASLLARPTLAASASATTSL